MKMEQTWKALHPVAAANDDYFTLFYLCEESVA
jgi:hypothetical protein